MKKRQKKKMNENEVSIIWKILIALSAGIFGVALAISLKQISLRQKKGLLIIAIVIHFTLSLGLFLVVMIFFKSGLLPDSLPNDDYSALVVAYLISATPQVSAMLLLVIYNKEVNRFLEKRYGESYGEDMHSENEKFTNLESESFLNSNPAAKNSGKIRVVKAKRAESSRHFEPQGEKSNMKSEKSQQVESKTENS